VTPSTAPDHHEPVLGWRVWLVVQDAGELRLASVLYPSVWQVRKEFVAECGPGGGTRPAPHRAPGGFCRCGIYAAASVEEAASYFDGRGSGTLGEVYRVIGQVALWGSVIEGDRGWRASHGYPHALYVPARSLTGASRLTPGEVALALTDYGVPVELLDAVTKRRVCASLAPDLRQAA
jgi:hypothetical protein